MRRALGLALLPLAGCQTAAPPAAQVAAVPPAPPTACVVPSQIPAEPPMVGQKFNGDAKHDLQVLAPNARALRQWGQDLRALLEQCVPAKPAAPAQKAAS